MASWLHRLLPGRVRLLELSRFPSEHSDLFASSSRGETPAAWPRVKGNLALHPSSSSLFRGSLTLGGQERGVEASLTSLSSPGWIVTAFLATRPILCSQTAKPLWKVCAFLAACEQPWGDAAAALSVSPAASLCALSPPAICLSFPLPLLRRPGGSSQSPHSKRTPPWGVTCWSRLTRDPLWPWGGKAPVPISPMRGKGGPSATCAALPTWPMTRPVPAPLPVTAGSRGAERRASPAPVPALQREML